MPLDTNLKKMTTIIILVLFLFFIYTCEFVFFGKEENFKELKGIGKKFSKSSGSLAEESVKQGSNKKESITDIIGGVLGATPIIGGITKFIAGGIKTIADGLSMFVGIFMLLGSLMTFSLSGVPAWMSYIFIPMTLIIWIILAYLIVGYIYAGIKALPTT